MRNVKEMMIVIYSELRLRLKKLLLSSGALSIYGHQRIAPNCKIRLSRTGRASLHGNISIESNTYIATRKEAELSIGKSVYINRNNCIVAHDKISIENYVTIGPNCCIFDHDHDLNHRGAFVTAPVIIEEGVWIGAGCIILKGVHLGRNCTIAAGSVVTKDVPSNVTLIQKRENEYLTRKTNGNYQSERI